jgi:FixJ family two-component response regulator
MCRALGLKARAYASGPAFLDALDTGTLLPDCLLLDTQMPEMTGPELQRQLVARGACVPTIVVTADDGPESRARYIASKVVEYLRKPIGAEELLLAIERAIELPRRSESDVSRDSRAESAFGK